MKGCLVFLGAVIIVIIVIYGLIQKESFSERECYMYGKYTSQTVWYDVYTGTCYGKIGDNLAVVNSSTGTILKEIPLAKGE